MRPLRLLFLYDRIYPEDLGGVEHRNREVAFALADRGHDVTLAGWASESSEPHPGVRVISLGRPDAFYNARGKRKTSNAIRLAWTALRLDLDGYDVVETANIPYLHLWPLALRTRWRRQPLLVSWYEYWGAYWRDYLGWKWPLYAAIERSTARLGARRVACSDLTRTRLAARQRAGETIELLPCGVDAVRVRQAAEAGAADGEAHSAPLLYAGRLMKGKRVDLLLRAIAQVEWQGDGPLLTVIGSGPEEARLHALCSELGLGEWVEFRGQVETNVDVWRALGRARVAVQPSSREGFGMFTLEAMAAGVPVVFAESPESAVAETVRDGQDGLCASATPEGLAGALQRMLDDEPLWQSCRASAEQRGRSYGWDHIAEQTEAILMEMVEARDGTAR